MRRPTSRSEASAPGDTTTCAATSVRGGLKWRPPSTASIAAAMSPRTSSGCSTATKIENLQSRHPESFPEQFYTPLKSLFCSVLETCEESTSVPPLAIVTTRWTTSLSSKLRSCEHRELATPVISPLLAHSTSSLSM